MDKLDETIAYNEAKKAFEESEGREPNMNDDKDMLVVSALQLGINHGYKMGYEDYYMPLCDECNFNRATCFGTGAYCDECSMNLEEEE